MNVFGKANILLPEVEHIEKWAVIACDQFTSQPEYWEEVEKIVGEEPSTLQMIFTESYLGTDEAGRIKSINETMEAYVQKEIFTEYPDAFIYVERTLLNGKIRKGIVGNVDLDTYDYSNGATSEIRATERTVIERIPPRKRIRKNASLELPHVILLCDDVTDSIIGFVEGRKDKLPMVYDFDLMQNGGHITGWLIEGNEVALLEEKIAAYMALTKAKYDAMGKAPMYYAVGDGNHSLATAKSCYEDVKQALLEQGKSEEATAHPARFALVELENLWDDAQQFEPIHRIVEMDNVEALLQALIEKACVATSEDGKVKGHTIKWYQGDKQGYLSLNPELGELPIGILQEFLDEYMSSCEGTIDYIHGEEALMVLSKKENVIGFEVPAIEKDHLFTSIVKDGVLPRKTFSMGHATEKRYYLETREIQ